jgi:hypothetical protein
MIIVAIEAVLVASAGISILVLPMSWEWDLFLLSITAVLCGHIASTSPWMFWRPWSERVILAGSSILFIGVLAYPRTREEIHEARHPNLLASEPLQYGMPADLLVDRVETEPPTRDVGLIFNVRIVNAGHAAAVGVQYLGKIVPTAAPMDARGEDRTFAMLDASPDSSLIKADVIDPAGSITLSVGDSSGPQAIKTANLEGYIKNRWQLYLVVTIRFRDRATGTAYRTDYCQRLDSDNPSGSNWSAAPARLCESHNTTYVAPSSG